MMSRFGSLYASQANLIPSLRATPLNSMTPVSCTIERPSCSGRNRVQRIAAPLKHPIRIPHPTLDLEFSLLKEIHPECLSDCGGSLSVISLQLAEYLAQTNLA